MWPKEAVLIEGKMINDAIPVALSKQPDARQREIAKAANDMTAWALMLCEQRAEAVVVVIFESPVGTKSWHRAIVRHGDVDVLEEPVEYTNTDYLGVRWRPRPEHLEG